MKTKIITIMLLISLLAPNFAFAAMTYERTGGEPLVSTATAISNDTYVDAKYDAETQKIKYYDNGEKNVEIYNYDETEKLQEVTRDDYGTTYSEANKNKYYLVNDDASASNNTHLFSEDSELLLYSILFDGREQEADHIATFIYKDAIKINNNKYDVKLKIKHVKKEEASTPTRLSVLIGVRQNAADDDFTLSTYSREEVVPFVYSGPEGERRLEADVEYYVVDDSKNEIPINGIFDVEDIDRNQGIYLNGIHPNPSEGKATNIFMKENENTDDDGDIMYKNFSDETTNGMYIYSSTADNKQDEYHDAYVLIDNKNKVETTFTFENVGAGSALRFVKDKVKRYKKITTSVTGGTITPDITNIKDNENKEISYTPGENKYLESITIDGEKLEPIPDTNKSSYTFENIVADHTIDVVYADKLTVEFDPAGGTPKPNDQYIIPKNKATKPETDPTKVGYEFKGWYEDPENDENEFNFETLITENKELTAKWMPVEYTITYELNGGTNSDQNPATYKITDDPITFKEPTKEGYDFKGWYKDETLTEQKTIISPGPGEEYDHENITVYAKWEEVAESDITYQIQYYLQTKDGTYEIDTANTETKTGKEGDTVTATPKTYPGYKENTKYKDRVATGTLTSDNDLTLKLYYDLNEYKVEFDPQGGTPDPDDQTVKHGNKATKPKTNPTKDGYIFKYWYYIDGKGDEVEYNFNDPVKSDIKLIAKWQKKSNTTEKKDNSSIEGKQDNSLADKVLPNTGIIRNFLIVVIMVSGLLGIRYYRLKNIMK